MWLIAGRRVPKHQQTVKIELFGCLQGTRHFEIACQCAEAPNIEHFGNSKMKERELAEGGIQPPVTYRRLRIDITRLSEPVDRILLAADLVGKLK